MIITDNDLKELRKSEAFKMLVRGVYLGTMEKEFSKMTKKQLVDECFKKEAQIFDLKDQLALTEKALELACEREFFCVKIGAAKIKECCKIACGDCRLNYFKTKAKEMMKSE